MTNQDNQDNQDNIDQHAIINSDTLEKPIIEPTIEPIIEPTDIFKQSQRFVQLVKILTCPLCQQILCDPVTLFCQHTLCQSCLVLKCQDKCYLCKTDIILPTNSNYQLKSIIDKIYSEDYFKERKDKFQQVLSNDLKLKKKYEIYKNYFSSLINKVQDKHGKFIVTNNNLSLMFH